MRLAGRTRTSAPIRPANDAANLEMGPANALRAEHSQLANAAGAATAAQSGKLQGVPASGQAEPEEAQQANRVGVGLRLCILWGDCGDGPTPGAINLAPTPHPKSPARTESQDCSFLALVVFFVYPI